MENEYEYDQLLLNRIRTPDGTILTSRHRHDYVEYTDKNGLMYMVDGGMDYARRTIHSGIGEEYEELSVYLTDDHEANRNAFHWGTYGKDGDQPLSYILLKDMTLPHILAVIETQKRIAPWVKELMLTELKYRKEEI